MAENGDDRLFPVEPVRQTRTQLHLRRSTDATIELREFGEWTLEKLKVLELYLKQYRRVAGNGTYIDGFAGQGSVAVTGRITDAKGSVRIALEAGAFKELWLFEIQPALMADLKTNLNYHYPPKKLRRVRLFEGDFNARIADLLDREVIPRAKPCFAFLDPNSTQLDWATVERLARFKEPASPPKTCKIELWVLFNSHQAFGRLVDRKGRPGYAASPEAATLDRVMGSREVWWPLFERGAHINAYARRYAERLREDLGYGFAVPQLIKDPATGRPQYFMIHASDHPAAFTFMRWAKKTSCCFDNTESFPGFEF